MRSAPKSSTTRRTRRFKTTTGWLVSCLLTLARAGRAPDRNRAEAARLCQTHGLDWDLAQRKAQQYPTRPDEGGTGAGVRA